METSPDRSDPTRHVRPSALGSALASYRIAPQDALRTQLSRTEALAPDFGSVGDRRPSSSTLSTDSHGSGRPGSRGGQPYGGAMPGVGTGGGGLRPRPSKRRTGPSRADSVDSPRARKRRSNVEESLLEERLKVANVVLPEDNLEDLVHLPIAPELLSRRQRLRDIQNGNISSTSLASSFYNPSLHSPSGTAPPTPAMPDLPPPVLEVPAEEAVQPMQSRIPVTSRARSKSLGRPQARAVSPPRASPNENVESWEVLQSEGGRKKVSPILASGKAPLAVQPSSPRISPHASPPSASPPKSAPLPKSPLLLKSASPQRSAPQRSTPQRATPQKSPSQKSMPLSKSTPRPRAVTGVKSAGNTPRKASAPLPKTDRRPERPRSLSVSSTPLDPPWVTDQSPRLYRVNAEGGEPRYDDMILPAVARQLEKRRMLEEAADGLVTEWDRDGNPKKIVRRPPQREDPPPQEQESDPPSRRQSIVGPAPPEHRRVALSARELGLPTSEKPDLDLAPLPKRRKEVWQEQEPVAIEKEEGHGGGCCRCVIM